jgi:hypothetical protein
VIPHAGKLILKYQDLCETYQIDFGLYGEILQIQAPDKVKPIERRMPLGTHRIDEGCITVLHVPMSVRLMLSANKMTSM